jgi:hypothetical protein
MILQVIVGGFAAAAVSLKLFWRRILNILHIRKPDEEEQTGTATPARHESRDSETAVAEPTR